MIRRRVLVTGSTSGIGFATAARLAAAGDSVVVTGRRPPTVDAALRRLGTGEGVVCDLHTPEGTAALVDRLRAGERGGALDAAVLSHGGSQVPEIFADADPAGHQGLAEAIFLTNARLAHGLLPLLAAAPGGGRLVVVVSEAGRFPTTGEVMIGALAAANLMFVRTLAREAARDGVRVHAVTVSLTRDTDTYDRVMGASGFSRRLFEKAEQRMPFGPVRADDVAATITHLLAPETSATTGQVVAVTGGLTT